MNGHSEGRRRDRSTGRAGRVGALAALLTLSAIGCGPAFPPPPTVSPVLLARPETRVRLEAPAVSPEPVEGRWRGETDGEVRIEIDGGREVVVPRERVLRAEISTGRHRNAIWGAVVGMAVAGIPSAIYWHRECEGSCRTPALTGFLVGGSLYGALPGALVGALIRTRRWEVWTGFGRGDASVAPTVGVRWLIPRASPSPAPRR